MKKATLIFIAMLLCLTTYGAWTYVFSVDKDTLELRATYKTKETVQTNSGQYVEITVTPAQYNAGYASLDTNIVIAAITQAAQLESDYSQWTDRERAMIDAFIVILNVRFNLPNHISKQEMIDALNTELSK